MIIFELSKFILIEKYQGYVIFLFIYISVLGNLAKNLKSTWEVKIVTRVELNINSRVYLKGIKFREYLISRLKEYYISRVFISRFLVFGYFSSSSPGPWTGAPNLQRL